MHLVKNRALDSDAILEKRFMPHQLDWIRAEDRIHAQHRQAVALAEKSVRIGWTYADAFKNVRKRIWFRDRNYLFATKDYPSALEYVRQCYEFAEIFNLSRSIISHGEEVMVVNRLDANGKPSAFTEDLRVGVIKFDNGSRIIAFSSSPQAMAVYGGDVGLDEFAKHPNARLLWETAQARVTWNYDLAIWSSHDGEDTLFNEFAQEARAAWRAGQAWSPLANPDSQSAAPQSPALPPSPIENQKSKIENPSDPQPGSISGSQAIDNPSAPDRGCVRQDHPQQPPTPPGPCPSVSIRGSSPIENQKSQIENPLRADAPRSTTPWNLYFRVTLPDAIQFGLVDRINTARGTKLSATQFLADCRARARDDEIFEQSYMCNPIGAAANHITEWSAIERCRSDYKIERVHLEADEIQRQFGEFETSRSHNRELDIAKFLCGKFPLLLAAAPHAKSANAPRSTPDAPRPTTRHRLGFDVAASGQGDLAAIYIDEAKGDQLWLRGLFTCRTEDWHFLKTVLFYFLKHLPNLQAAGDESGLGRQICWEAAKQFSSRFLKVNFAAKKHDLGFSLMNQLSVAEKRFPKSEADIAADFFALRKAHNGNKWAFSEGPNHLNAASHCDMAWAGALATHAHTERRCGLYAAVVHETGWSDAEGFHPFNSPGTTLSPEAAMLLSDDPRIWRRWG